MAKNPTPEEEITALERDCKTHFDRWDYLYTNGGTDPIWEDGYNLNLVRNHIMYCQREIEELCGNIGYFMPEICTRELPPVVENSYMARKDEILAAAIRVLELFRQDEDYQKLLSYSEVLTDDQKKKISYNAVIGYVTGLEMALVNSDYVTMRRFGYYQRYQESFKECIERINSICKKMRNK